MKTLKKILTIVMVLGLIVGIHSRSNAQQAQDAYYFVILLKDGNGNDNPTYASKPIYYPGYDKTRTSASDYDLKVRQEFKKYLEAYHDLEISYNDNFKTLSTVEDNPSDKLKSISQANQRLTEWITEMKRKKEKHILTTFTYSR